MSAGKPEVEQALSRSGRTQGIRENLEIKEIVVGDGEARKRYVLVRNPQQAERDRKVREDLIAHIEEELRGLRDLPEGCQRPSALSGATGYTADTSGS